MELLKIFDEHHNEIGVASRDEAHEKGLWHEVFQCWLVSREQQNDMIYLQLRSENKKDYPALFDITAAGHLLSNETVENGIREIAEELGIEVAFDNLISLGVISTCMTRENFIDHEFANVFLYVQHEPFEQFDLQLEEVAGIVKVSFNDFKALWRDELSCIDVNGFQVCDGQKKLLKKTVKKGDFVPHPTSYYVTVIERIEQYINLLK